MLLTLVTVTLLSIIQFVPNRFELIAVSIEMTKYINKMLKVLNFGRERNSLLNQRTV